MSLNGIVASLESYEIVSDNQIKPGYFSELVIDLGHKKFKRDKKATITISGFCLLYTSPSPRD